MHNSMRDIAEHILEAMRAGRDMVLVTVADVEGSAPRHVGTQMLVSSDGLECGTIGGGKVEAHGISEARAMIEEAAGDRIFPQSTEIACSMGRLENLGLRLRGKRSLGMACGGDACLLYAFVSSADACWKQVAAEVLRCIDQRIPANLVLKCVDGDAPFAMQAALIDADGKCLAGGCLPNESDGAIGREEMPRPNAAEGCGSICRGGDCLDSDISSIAAATSAGRVADWFVMPVPVPVRAVVFGGGHVGQATVAALARVGFAVTLFDDRPEFANAENNPAASEVVLGDYGNIGASIKLDTCDYVLIMTSGHASDIAVLGQALAHPLAYVGMIGSRRKIATARECLRAQGVTDAALDAVHMPIGLDIKAETPEEIAVSIAAECILHRATADER